MVQTSAPAKSFEIWCGRSCGESSRAEFWLESLALLLGYAARLVPGDIPVTCTKSASKAISRDPDWLGPVSSRPGSHFEIKEPFRRLPSAKVSNDTIAGA